jgi:hypothetical protein
MNRGPGDFPAMTPWIGQSAIWSALGCSLSAARKRHEKRSWVHARVLTTIPTSPKVTICREKMMPEEGLEPPTRGL